MGKGDKKTRRGKIFAGSFGVRRKRKPGEPVKTVSVEKTIEPAKTKKSKS